MATFTRPTFSTILARVLADINSNLPGADSRLRRSILNVLAYCLAGLTHGLYGFTSYLALQIFPDTASTDYLDRWGAIYGVTRKSSTPATGTVVFTGTNGTSIPSGTQVQRSDLALFATTADATIGSGTATVNVSAVVAGLASNTVGSSVFSMVTPITGVSGTVTVNSSGLLGGADLETDQAYSLRILAKLQAPVQGGSAQDYVTWAKQVAGVTRAWCYPVGGGSPDVTVYFMMDETYSDGIPLTGDVTTVQNYMNDLVPVTANLTVAAPTATTQAFTLHLIDNDDATIRAGVEAALLDLIKRDATPGGTIYLSQITQAINGVPNVFASTLATPSGNVTASSAHITTLGTVTFT